MAFSAAVRSDFSTTNQARRNAMFDSPNLQGRSNRSRVLTLTTTKRKCSLHPVVSVLGNQSSSINVNGAAQPARVLLERLFAHAYKLEEQMNGNSDSGNEDAFGLNLETLESEFQAAFKVLKEKEEDLQEAERMVTLELAELKRSKEEVERREQEIAAASSRQQRLEDELREANLKLFSQARHMDDLKSQLKERNQEISMLQSALSLKEAELDKVRSELIQKIAEADEAERELKNKVQNLNNTDEIIDRQENEIRELRKALQEKEEELLTSVSQMRIEEGALKVSESQLAQRTLEWLVSLEEIRKMREAASKQMAGNKQTMEELLKVKKLANDVRSELVSCQNSLAASRQRMEEREVLLEKQLAEIEEQKKAMGSYMRSLEKAHSEVESERLKLRSAEARNEELHRDLSTERKLMHDLEDRFQKERSKVQHAIQQMSTLQNELTVKTAEFTERTRLFHAKEAELIEAKSEIQRLHSEHASLQLILQERDLELVTAKERLNEVNEEVAGLRKLMNSKEEKLLKATAQLKEQEKQTQSMQGELTDATRRYSEAEYMVEEIADLTNNLIDPSMEDDYPVLDIQGDMGGELLQKLPKDPNKEYKRKKWQLEAELKLTQENLRAKEMEVLSAQRSLTMKDQELETVSQRLAEKEKELKRSREEMLKEAEELKRLYALAHEKISGKTVSELAIERLQLEASQLEIEAATSALQKLADMSRELATMSSDSDSGSGADVVENPGSLSIVRSEVARLSALTESLVEEAGIDDIAEEHQ